MPTIVSRIAETPSQAPLTYMTLTQVDLDPDEDAGLEDTIDPEVDDSPIEPEPEPVPVPEETPLVPEEVPITDEAPAQEEELKQVPITGQAAAGLDDENLFDDAPEAQTKIPPTING